MKAVNVKKSLAVLGLSKKSKDKLKTKKKSKLSVSSPKKNVLSKHLLENQSKSDKKGNVRIVDIKNAQKLPVTSPKTSKKAEKKNSKKKHISGQKGVIKNTPQKTGDSTSNKEYPVTKQSVNYIDKKKVIPPVQALLTHCKTKNKKALFKSEGLPIFVQFESIAVPKHPKTTLRLVLPHSPHSKVADVLLIITDEKKHHRKLRHDDEMYIINFTEKLKELGVTQVSQVMTLRQIRAEYYTHEMRRKLCDMFDVFLVDGKLGQKLSSLIGRNFFKLRKTPIPVSLEKEDKIKLEIERGLRKTQIVLKSTCCTNSVCTIGSTEMKAEEIAENLEAFSKGLDTCKYPGGWRNIKSVHLKTPTSIAFPVYYSFVTPNEIDNAELKQTLPKHCVAVKGELSTIGRDVIVRPDGSIEVEGVDDMRSLMHQLYKHAGFKDHEDLDLTNAEYKEVVKELQKHIPVKPKPEDRNAPTARDVSDLLDNNASESDDAASSSSDEDDNTIQGEIQREDNVHGDFEDNDDEDEDEKGDDVEQSYMQQWQETWLNQESEDEQEAGEQKGKKKKNKNVKNQSKNSGDKYQQSKVKANKKRKQKSEEGQGSKKQKTDYNLGKQGGKKADKQSAKVAGKLNKAKSKKDTPLRQANVGGAKNADADPVVQKKKAKRAGSKTPNYIPL